MLKQSLNLDFHLEFGAVLKSPSIAYSTYGKLNEEKNNVICVCHALTANSDVHEWWPGLFGPGKLFDPDQYFIICINNLGSPYGTISAISENPLTGQKYGLSFPFFTIRDTALMHLALLDKLEIQNIAFLIGGSCGGNIAQEMAILKPSLVKRLALLCCSAKETPWVVGVHESQRLVLEAHPDLFTNNPEQAQKALKGARAFALPLYRSYESFILKQSEETDQQVDDFKAAFYLRYQGDKFCQRYDVHCYYTQLKALDTHHVGRAREGIQKALSQITAKTIVIGFSSDLLIPVAEQKSLAEAIPDASYIQIDTIYGHDAFLIETDEIGMTLMDWGINTIKSKV